MKYLIALDQGTTSSRAIVFDENGRTMASHAIEFKQHYPHPGWVEHDPDDILNTQVESLRKAVEEFYLAREMGFDDINMDVIAGLPGETEDHFRHTMEVVSSMISMLYRQALPGRA
ncbi:MAG: hypothetical protein IJ041_04515 [Clostridia bacterium]|nr:hypothetical protein [Clostridia bacterium]